VFGILVRRADDLVVSDRGRRLRSSIVGARLFLRLGPPASQERREQAEPAGTRIYWTVRSQNVSIDYAGR
jgi:hypothetical protein